MTPTHLPEAETPQTDQLFADDFDRRGCRIVLMLLAGFWGAVGGFVVRVVGL